MPAWDVGRAFYNIPPWNRTGHRTFCAPGSPQHSVGSQGKGMSWIVSYFKHRKKKRIYVLSKVNGPKQVLRLSQWFGAPCTYSGGKVWHLEAARDKVVLFEETILDGSGQKVPKRHCFCIVLLLVLNVVFGVYAPNSDLHRQWLSQTGVLYSFTAWARYRLGYEKESSAIAITICNEDVQQTCDCLYKHSDWTHPPVSLSMLTPKKQKLDATFLPRVFDQSTVIKTVDASPSSASPSINAEGIWSSGMILA
jgi:hypothetical protein